MPANSVFTELVTTTFRKHRKGFKDNVTNRNATLKYMYQRGNYRTEDGGTSIVEPLDYAQNSTYQRFSDWDTLNIGASDVLSAAEYPWKQVALHVIASLREQAINSGASRIENLVASRIKNAMRTFDNNFSADVYGAGTLANQINGLGALIADTNTNTVGGIDASLWPFWQNTVFDLSDNGVTISSTTIENSVMLPLWLSLDRGPGDHPDLIVMDNAWYGMFESSQVSIKRYTEKDKVNAGFVSIAYKNADVLYDGNSGITASRMYFTNTSYLKLCVHKDYDLEVMPEKESYNQAGSIIPIFWMGNMTCSNRKQQGVVKP